MGLAKFSWNKIDQHGETLRRAYAEISIALLLEFQKYVLPLKGKKNDYERFIL